MSDSKAANLYCGISIAVGFRASADITNRSWIRADHDHTAAFSKVITGAPDRFTGSVRVRSFFDAKSPAGSTGGEVTFQPRARSAWHTHPHGQVLIVTDGVGWVQQWGSPVQVMHKEDVVWIPPGVKHWHGATPTTSVTHIALQEEQNGMNVSWMEKVTDEQYKLGK
jgi:quercetin dioxygenase-like cupin family protein